MEAFRAHNFKVGFYHSVIDWHHPEFPVDGLHPMRENLAFREAAKNRDIAKYRTYLHGQTRAADPIWAHRHYVVRLLVCGSRLGLVQGQRAEDWDSARLMQMVRELHPNILVNDRLGIGGDLKTPEQYQPAGK
ncbi:MAG: alpha-L-fucosidase [Caldilineaceae bacterium]